uniref:PKD_channel domain-containing protein n=1 Tax=Panagrellus redivivus TaxID=6233 RepID=A0A7E4VVA7_PANRE
MFTIVLLGLPHLCQADNAKSISHLFTAVMDVIDSIWLDFYDYFLDTSQNSEFVKLACITFIAFIILLIIGSLVISGIYLADIYDNYVTLKRQNDCRVIDTTRRSPKTEKQSAADRAIGKWMECMSLKLEQSVEETIKERVNDHKLEKSLRKIAEDELVVHKRKLLSMEEQLEKLNSFVENLIKLNRDLGETDPEVKEKIDAIEEEWTTLGETST